MTPSINNELTNANYNTKDYTAHEHNSLNGKPLVGRAVNWLKNTSSGRLGLTLASGVAVGTLALLTVASAVSAIAAFVLGALLITTGVGIPLAFLLILVVTPACIAGGYAFEWGTKKMTEILKENYRQMKELSSKEANFG